MSISSDLEYLIASSKVVVMRVKYKRYLKFSLAPGIKDDVHKAV